jgi:hypothetical protein
MKRILLAVFCVIVCGCVSPPECNSALSYPHWTEWDDGKLISIVNDSLAVLASQRYKKECKSNEETTGSRSGLFLVNYRTKQKPLSVDTYEYIFKESNQFHSSLNIIENYFKDSSVLAFDMKNGLFGSWKIGTDFIFFKKYTYQEDYALKKANPWINGNILFKNSKKESDIGETWDMTPMLNTKNGQISMLDFSGEYEWLNKCLDVSYIGEKIVCIKINKETNRFELVANGVVTDDIPIIYNNYAIAFDGNYIIIGIRYSLYSRLSEIRKIDAENLKFSNTFTPVLVYDVYNSYGGTRFYDVSNFENIDDIIANIDYTENFVQYTSKDLYRASN